MKEALISPLEPVAGGYRVAQVATESFEVALPFYWMRCADDVVADEWYFDPTTRSIKQVPAPQEPTQPVSQGAQTL
jgi:hypothetical protein